VLRKGHIGMQNVNKMDSRIRGIADEMAKIRDLSVDGRRASWCD
jgi:hypothetical protein